MIAIYSITHRASGKRYIGKSKNAVRRRYTHKWMLTRATPHKNVNRHLYNAVQKHGWSAFDFEIIEEFTELDEEQVAARELHWMTVHHTCDRRFGYNLRRDSSTRMIVHEETRAKHSETIQGEQNPNYGNHWTPEQKQRMSEDAIARHEAGRYDSQWRKRLGAASRRLWSDLGKRRAMGRRVALAKQQYDYLQFDRGGRLLRRWNSVAEIVEENPGYKWQNIYSVCHGHKPTYRGFVWRQERRRRLLFPLSLFPEIIA